MLTNLRKQVPTKNLKMNLIFSFRGLSKFNFAAAEKLPTLEGKPNLVKGGETNAIQPWVEIENRLAKMRGELILAEHGQIENYVLGVIKGYFRTTYKEGLTMNSNLSEHGLDSLDAIELGMILEDELGYIIEAETLPQFTKVKHFVNYIKQMEAYKKEFVTLPQERAQQAEESWDDWIPYGEKLKSKLYGMTTPKTEKKEKKPEH